MYGLGSGVYVLLLLSGVATWHGESGVDGAIGYAEPISFAGYGVALTVAVISYQLRTRPIRTAAAPCPIASPATASHSFREASCRRLRALQSTNHRILTKKRASWRLFAEIVQAATGYE